MTGRSDIEPFVFVQPSDEDVLDAMGDVPGYLDITPEDFVVVYRLAVRHAIERVGLTKRAGALMRTDAPTVDAALPLLVAAERMALAATSFAPVVGADHCLAGVVAVADLLATIGTASRGGLEATVATFCTGERCLVRHLEQMSVTDAMRTAISVPPAATLGDLLRLNGETGHQRFPVASADGRYLGLVSLADVTRACFR